MIFLKRCYVDKNKLEELAFKSRISLNCSEYDKLIQELNDVISFCSSVKDFSLEDNEKIIIEEIDDIVCGFRKDVVVESTDEKDVFSNADKFDSTYFLVERNLKN